MILPKIGRDAIVSIAALSGAQAVAVLISSSMPGQSSSCLQWASESIGAVSQRVQYAVQPPPASESGYYDVRTHRDETVYEPGAAQTSASPDTSSAEMSLIPDVTQAEYQARRRAYRP